MPGYNIEGAYPQLSLDFAFRASIVDD